MGTDLCVVIQKEHILARRHASPLVAGTGKASVLLQSHRDKSITTLLEIGGRTISGGVVHDNQLTRRVPGILDERVDTPTGILQAIKDGHYDTDCFALAAEV